MIVISADPVGSHRGSVLDDVRTPPTGSSLGVLADLEAPLSDSASLSSAAGPLVAATTRALYSNSSVACATSRLPGSSSTIRMYSRERSGNSANITVLLAVLKQVRRWPGAGESVRGR